MRRPTDLPPDLLREVSRRLHDAADFVRFHAVCRAWRGSHSRDVPLSPTNQFPPWLLAPNTKDNDFIKIRCVFSKRTYRGLPSAHQRNCVANADGTAVRYFTASCSGLHDALTGAHTLTLPPFPDRSYRWEREEDPSGIVCGDGTVLLFNKSSKNRFRAALLRPGDAAWTLIERNLQFIYGEFCIVYHRSKIMVTAEASKWHVIAENNVVEDDVLVPMTWMPNDYIYMNGYTVETRGELLWVSIQIDAACYKKQGYDSIDCLRVFVHALQEPAKGEEKLRWVIKDGRSLADRVLFLGWPNSFAVDASRSLGGDGGYVYFPYEHSDVMLGGQTAAVYRCNLVDMKVELVEWLPEGWHEEMCTWLVPQPAIAPIPVR